MKDSILQCLRKFETQPFLFIGSGTSIRYLGLENWEGLLRKFSKLTSNSDYSYEKYNQQIRPEECREGVYPKIAELIEKDFNMKWFDSGEFIESKEIYKEKVQKGVSPFKIEIAKYMMESSNNTVKEYSEEIELFCKIGKQRSIGGIITTNYDMFLENAFSDYKKYIGQEELIFSPIQGIGEIYKIHGCCTKPESIIINENDYIDFNEKNAYLASKILTIFLEHPIIFLGYSISDKNVENILKSIVKCLSPENLLLLKERLIFIERNEGNDSDALSTYSKVFEGGKSIDMTRIRLKNYDVLYQALIENKSKFRANVLRKLKLEIYELVKTNKPSQKVRVIGLEDEEHDNVEIVIGVGVIADIGKKGYSSYKVDDIYRDIVFDDGNYNPEWIVVETLPELIKRNRGVPIYKYISKLDIDLPDIVSSEIKEAYNEFLSKTIIKKKEKGLYKKLDIKRVRSSNSDIKTLELISYLEFKNIDVNELHKFLKEFMTKNPDTIINSNNSARTNLRRLIKIYDWLKYYKNKK